MVILSVNVIPHGAMILDPNMPGLPAGAEQLHTACQELAETIISQSPETVILFTPHGIAMQNTLGVYLNDTCKGSAEWSGNWSEFSLCCNCDASLAREILHAFRQDGICTEGIVSFAQSESAPMRWGEIVPLWFLRKLVQDGVNVVVISWPQTRFHPHEYAESFREVGKSLFRFCSHHPRKVSVVFSCDTSHVHGNPENTHSLFAGSASLGDDKPLAISFDSSIVEWIQSLIDGDVAKGKEILFEKAAVMAGPAKACGWAGFCCIQGCFDEAKERLSTRWSGRLYAYAAPTYYGMLVVSLVMT